MTNDSHSQLSLVQGIKYLPWLKYPRWVESAGNLLKPKAAGPKSPFKDRLQCEALDSELQNDFNDRFSPNDRLPRSEALDFLRDSFRKHPEMSRLYDNPTPLLDTADKSVDSHWDNRLKEKRF